MDKYVSDQHIHDGHRERMRSKLISHGQKIFDTYELLEMLLYYVIPYKDTNPIAKRLLMKFGSLDGVLSASKEELSAVPGIGDKAAELIRNVNYLKSVLGAEFCSTDDINYKDYDKAADCFINHFKGSKEYSVAAMVLDNNMNLIKFDTLYHTPFSSGAVQPKPFVDMVLDNKAAVLITAHNNPFGSTFPTPSDRETIDMLAGILKPMNVFYVEHYIVSGTSYSGIMRRFAPRVTQSPELESFLAGKRLHEILEGTI